MTKQTQGRLSVHPYIGGTAYNLLANAKKNGWIDVKYLPTLIITLFGTMITFPIRIMERLIYARKIEQTEIKEDPIFIIGHWRSGTTHLHNILAQDKSFGYLSTLQAIFPTCGVIISKNKFLKNIIAKLIPEQRMMDNVKMDLDFPQEEEFSLSCLTTSAHHCNHFPKTILDSFNKYVLFSTSHKEIKQWEKTYMAVIKKATYMARGKRLILKNPYNMARIKMLLKLFPNAKFIHIYRNPYNIYVSALHDFIKEADEMALQLYSEEEFSEICFTLYEKIMKTYWQTREMIPEGNLYEMAYERLIDNPEEEIKKVYERLSLDRNNDAINSVNSYIQATKRYKKNKYTYSASVVEKIKNKWGFAIHKMNYKLPEDILIKEDKDWTCKMEY